jgi:hypothetical protein
MIFEIFNAEGMVPVWKDLEKMYNKGVEIEKDNFLIKFEESPFSS